jgi:gliding motility-associated-like protein
MKLYLGFILLFTINITFAQNQANYWYFGEHKGLNFNDGTPIVLLDGQTNYGLGNATISDSNGNLLFYTAGHGIHNKEHLIMANGLDLNGPGVFGRAIVRMPGQNNLYYIFTARHPQIFLGFYYSVVDMTLDGGLGAVIEKDVPVDSGWDSADRIALAKKENSEDVWVVTRKFTEDAIASYLINTNGFHPDPVLSEMPDRYPNLGSWGFLKILYNKKYLISSYLDEYIEVCNFNPSSGAANYMYTLHKPGGVNGSITGIEFSPDSKYLYVSFSVEQDTNAIYQFDIEFISNQSDFNNSATFIGMGQAMALQLARDGKIYCISEISGTRMSVINNPWIAGVGCDFQNNIIEMNPGDAGYSLPNILLDYLYRFEWEGEPCQGSPIRFIPNFIPTPDSIRWFFDEFAPGSISYELSPVYTFQNAGIHEVEVDIWYPTGRFEHTSREIEIFPTPYPDLGPDTLICQGSSLTLNANCIADIYSWSTGQIGSSSITISDSGTYWARAAFFATGCAGFDTIHVGFHPATTLDESGLIITPTTCNEANGSITGLTALGPTPLAYRWEDLSGDEFGTGIDVSGLPAGQYYLTITDANGCETVSELYTIEDAGNLQVLEVQLTQPHCVKDDGQIVVHAYSPSGSILEYSIDAGANYQYDSVFSGLFAMSYVVQVKDENECDGFYFDNPVILADIPGPQVTLVNVTDETDFLGNGSIEIEASGSTPVIYYSMDGGTTYQSNNGTFNNLGSGIYNLLIWDENGCDTTFTVEIQNVILTYLHAVTEEGGHCLGNTAMVSVNVDNFSSVADFHLMLDYNVENLQCEGFINVHPQLLDSLTGWVDQAAGDIHLSWNGELPLTFSQPAKVADLVFTTKNPGQGELSWYTGETESYFTNSSGDRFRRNSAPGRSRSTSRLTSSWPRAKPLHRAVCHHHGHRLGQPASDQLPLDLPNGDTDNNDPFFFSVSPADAGLYTLLATDHVGCTDQKSIELIVSENPVAAFHGTDTLEMQAGDVLDAGLDYLPIYGILAIARASIVINAEGMYFVEMESPIGCLGSDSVYVKLKEEEIPPEPNSRIFIPNAFSPDGDGVNDVFRVVAEGLSIFDFRISIFDRWGGEVFSGEGASTGWDGKKAGKDCPGGVYVYKIVFSVDGVPGSQERVGTVMLVR